MLSGIAVIATVLIVITAVGAQVRETSLESLTANSYEYNLTKNSSVGLEKTVNQSDTLFAISIPLVMLAMVLGALALKGAR